MGKPVGVLVRHADELAAVRVGNQFLAAPGTRRSVTAQWHSDLCCLLLGP